MEIDITSPSSKHISSVRTTHRLQASIFPHSLIFNDSNVQIITDTVLNVLVKSISQRVIFNLNRQNKNEARDTNYQITIRENNNHCLFGSDMSRQTYLKGTTVTGLAGLMGSAQAELQ